MLPSAYYDSKKNDTFSHVKNLICFKFKNMFSLERLSLFFFSPSMSTSVLSTVDFWLSGDRSWPSVDLSEI